MLYTQAQEILGVQADTDKKTIKKRYRQLMHMVHPDTFAAGKTSYRYSAQEINEAYSVLMKQPEVIKTDYKYSSTQEEEHAYGSYTWDAPVNENAYTSRNIYHYAEGYDGNIIGSFKIAGGRYIWKVEEDFPLFIKSIFECSDSLLNGIDRELDRQKSFSEKLKVQAELAYLLAQQFIDAAGTLDRLITPLEYDTYNVFYIPSMLEMSENAPFVRAGMTLYPAGIRNHRLYLMTKAKNPAGYISFKDDRLYYIVIPLLEQKRAQVKVEVSKKQDRMNTRMPDRYKNLDFWLKVPYNNAGTFPENINMQIEDLLVRYRNN